MYLINNVIDGKTYCLHDQRDRDLRVIEPRLIVTLNKTGALSFRIPQKHRYYGTIRKMRSSIQVIEDGKLIFEGRALTDSTDFYNTAEITCEGSLSYLFDSVQRPFSITGNIHDFFEKMIQSHNSQVEERKQFVLGRVNVADEKNDFKRENTGLDSTWNVLKTTLIDVHGGYIWVEYKDGKKYLNYTYDYGGINEQQIRFGVNLLDLTKYQDATNVITCLIPYGGTIEYEDELGGKQTKTVDITSVNDGRDYIMADQAVIDEYGKIWGSCQWIDITDPARLLEKAKEYLKEAGGIPDCLKVSAVDLNYAGADIRRFKAGYYVTAVSKPHGIQKDMLLSQLDLYLDDPAKGSITLGNTVDSFTGTSANHQANFSKALQESENKTFDEMARKIANATTLITGGFGGYVVLDNINPATGKKMHPWRILVMNTPDKKTAQNIIQINQNGIGFSTTGINGPYRNAWTIDGNLVADFVTTGTMLADRIRGGTLEVGGTGLGKAGIIRVLNASGQEIVKMDTNGVMIRSGKLDAPKIKGGSADFGNGLFMADDDAVIVGGFEARYGWGREIFQSYDQMCGLSAEPNKKGGLWIWAGWNNDSDYDFCVNNRGEAHCRELYIESKQGFWQGWSLSDTMKDVYERLRDLESQISNI